MSNLEGLCIWLMEQGVPPRPGLVFDRQKHRWVRPHELSSADLRNHLEEMNKDLRREEFDVNRKKKRRDSAPKGSAIRDHAAKEYSKANRELNKKLDQFGDLRIKYEEDTKKWLVRDPSKEGLQEKSD